MLKTAMIWFRRAVWLAVVLLAAFAAWFLGYGYTEIAIGKPLQFSLKHGSSLRSAAQQMQAAGALRSPRQFELLARIYGVSDRIQAGNYELGGALTPVALLRKITSGDRTQDRITFVEGWTLAQVRAALDSHAAIRHDTQGIVAADLVKRLGIPYASAEGLFLPDTYYFPNGTSDGAIMQRAFRAMQAQLDSVWNSRASGLPLENPYQALILASIIEKETGRPDERTLIAAVFVNRLKLGMRLQTDPTVIYGLGAEFDGDLRKRDLLADGAYNTYTRDGLPPTPIAMPGADALAAALNPAPSKALYFVARGDGTSYFSATLAEHERAVTKYQRRGKR